MGVSNLSDKCFKVSNEVFKKHKEIYKFDWVLRSIFTIGIICSILYCLNFFSDLNSIMGYVILTIIVLSCSIIIVFKSRTYNSKVNKSSMSNEVLKILNENNINDKSSIQLLKEELKIEIAELKDDLNNKKGRINRIFLYVFWIPSGFLCAFYFNSNDAVLQFEQLKDLALLLFGLAIQIISLIMMLSVFEKEMIYLMDSRNKRCILTLDYLNDYLYYSKSLRS